MQIHDDFTPGDGTELQYHEPDPCKPEGGWSGHSGTIHLGDPTQVIFTGGDFPTVAIVFDRRAQAIADSER